MNKKILFIALFFILLFLGEIAISFSFKKDNDRNLPNSDIIPLSHKISGIELNDSNTALFDSTIVEFIRKNKIEGASVAVANKGRLVYAKGFGWASKDEEIPVSPNHLFRIASVSKLITAITIMKLVEEEKITLEDQVFGENAILSRKPFNNYTDKRLEKITVKNLLEHTAGWNNKKGDPVFNSLYIAYKMNIPPPASSENIIDYSLQKGLDWTPGRKYSYSNLGYIILGEIIEEVTDMDYEEYVQFAILQPLGIYDMHIGRSLKENKYPNEVSYYDRSKMPKVWSFDGSKKLVPVMYGGNNIEVLGAAGGWIASAPELAKLLVAVDGFSSRPDNLSKETIDVMTSKSKKDKNLIGWRNSDGYGTWWRTGTLTGSAALVMRHKNELNWVVLFNTSIEKSSRIHSQLSGTMYKALRTVDEWPDFDLFNYEPTEFHASK
ncbi:MAG: beta-lactamase family protein [Bacteroidales bacterium]|nr:beta-lactamase family protein [Bacteroidales bacterium]